MTETVADELLTIIQDMRGGIFGEGHSWVGPTGDSPAAQQPSEVSNSNFLKLSTKIHHRIMLSCCHFLLQSLIFLSFGVYFLFGAWSKSVTIGFLFSCFRS